MTTDEALQEGPVSSSSTSGRRIRLLYFFAGQARKGDVRSYLHELQGTECHVDIEEFDLERGQNLLSDEIWLPLLRRIKTGEFDLLLLSPPCHTWSRAPWSNDSGPKPLRSSDWPTGFPWLKGADKTKVDEGTEFITRSLEIIQVAHECQVPWLIEHPEDLGPTARGTPASIWSWETSRRIFTKLQATTVALHQCAYGSDFRKRTRFTGTWHDLPSLGFAGWPVFKNGQYAGPLPRKCGHQHPPLVGRDSTGAFKTAPTAAYGPGLCKALAVLALKTAASSQSRKGGEIATDEAVLSSDPLLEGAEKFAANLLGKEAAPTKEQLLQIFDPPRGGALERPSGRGFQVIRGWLLFRRRRTCWSQAEYKKLPFGDQAPLQLCQKLGQGFSFLLRGAFQESPD